MAGDRGTPDIVQFNVPDLEGLTAVERAFAVATADGTNEDQLVHLSNLLRRVREAFHMDVVFVSEFVGLRRVFRHVSARKADANLIHEGESEPLEQTYCAAIVEGRLPRAIRNARAIPEARRLKATERLAIGSHLAVPIVLRDGKVYGTICCFSHGVREELGEKHVEQLQAVARLVAQALERKAETH
jgi:GAF domain-containing protein